MSEPGSSSPRRVIPTSVGLLKLVRAKSEWHWRPSSAELKRGFRGWHQRGYLPHFDAPNVTQIVTFMLADSFPVWRRAEWEPILREPDLSVRRRRLEAWLDRGHGECWLRRRDVAESVERVLLAQNPRSYVLLAWCVMPNHVHLVVRVIDMPLARLVKQWKGRSSFEANRLLGRQGALWQEEYFDTRVRDPEQLARAIRYVEQNPCKAKFVRDSRQWEHSSARRRDRWARLPWEHVDGRERQIHSPSMPA